MSRCEDYPCCGHGPAPYGDNGGCPDAQGRFNCVSCGQKMRRGWRSAICADCHRSNARAERDDLGMSQQDHYDWDNR